MMARRTTIPIEPTSIPVRDIKALLAGLGEVFDPGEAEEPILSRPVRSAVKGWLDEIHARDELAAVGVKPRSAALFSGPPGCGKTTLAWHLAARLGVPLVTVGSEHLLASSLGDSEKNVERLFRAFDRIDGAAVLLLDEIEAIGSRRRSTEGDGGGARQAMNSTLNVLLRRIEGFGGIMIGATNLADQLDPALWRRFGMQIEVGIPDDDCRWAILRRYGLPFAFTDQVIDSLAEVTDGAAPALLRQLMEGIKRRIVLGARSGSPPASLADAVAIVSAEARPHPDYAPPPLWDSPRQSIEIIRNVTDGQPWPPEREMQT